LEPLEPWLGNSEGMESRGETRKLRRFRGGARPLSP